MKNFKHEEQENMFTAKHHLAKSHPSSWPVTIFTGLFTGALLMAVIAGAKLVMIGPFLMDGGLLIYASTFIVTDIVAEVYGKRQAVRIVQSGFFALIAAFAAIQISFTLPAAAEWTFSTEYAAVLGIGSRVFIAAVISYVISQYLDLTLFAWFRDKTNGRHLWLRNNVSTILGGGTDAIVFTVIAFYGIYPVLPIIITAFTARMIFSLLDTPFVYLAVWFLKNR